MPVAERLKTTAKGKHKNQLNKNHINAGHGVVTTTNHPSPKSSNKTVAGTTPQKKNIKKNKYKKNKIKIRCKSNQNNINWCPNIYGTVNLSNNYRP